MNLKEKEESVKELYEKYPYPARNTTNTNEIIYFAQWTAKIFGETKDYWRGKKILELGCGTGELACALALCKAKVTAVDFSSTSIKKARELSRKLKVNKKTLFIEENILDLDSDFFGGKKFDCVIALGSLHHTINALKSFQIACTHTKPNGLVIIGLYNKYARLRHRIRRGFLKLVAGNNIEKRIQLGEKFFGTKKNGEKSWSADKYGQIHESYHSVKEVIHWFHEEGIEFIASKPEFERPIIDEIKWLLEKKGAFFVMTGKKKLL